ncbi:hypothetical protein [Novosphingobium sp.]|uniref:hypothetical protein n=1 Tax=Novosphingobium sp. TaxID=1874826 RepID=UPI00286D8BC1|nr:hypothetical protein [Novosphingobium sp.]
MAAFDLGVANLLGIAVYLASALVAVVTAVQTRRDAPGKPSLWLVVAAVFVGLALFRLSGAEEAIRQALRTMLVERMEYEERRVFQTGAVLACLTVVGIGAYFYVPRMVLWPRWLAMTSASLGALAVLYALRIISLHGVDRILYASIGPLHFNHVLELMPIAAIWLAAWDYRHGQMCRGRGRSGRPETARR